MQICGFRPPAPRCRVNADELYETFLKGEAGCTVDHMAYLDRGLANSPFQQQVPAYPERLHTGLPAPGPGPAFPALGQVPAVDESKLSFLHPEITNACVAVASWEDGALHARWSGRNSTAPVQQWSCTKMIPMARVASEVNRVSPETLLEDCRVLDPASSRSIPVPEAFEAIVSYGQGGSKSNQLAKMFKQFDTPNGLEQWLKGATGNQSLVFRGGYGEAPFINRPLLADANHELLHASGADHKGDNLVSSYDLCRFVGEIGWHAHLPETARLPHLQQSGVDTLVRGLGTDCARFTDVALDALGMNERIGDPVVISKMGFGLSDLRHQYEEVYTAFVQFTDTQTGKPYQVAMSLRGARPPGNEGQQGALKLDARMAAQITLILDKVMSGEL